MDKSNLIFIGFMAAGKTSVGQKTASLLKMNFIDTDFLIEEKMSMTVSEIFAKFGEQYFRKKESEITKEISNSLNTVIATGGGIVTNPYNIETLKKTGITIWLKAPLNIILERVRKDYSRPLLVGKNSLELEELFEKRCELYKKYCDFTIDVTGKNIEEISQEIVELFKKISS